MSSSSATHNPTLGDNATTQQSPSSIAIDRAHILMGTPRPLPPSLPATKKFLFTQPTAVIDRKRIPPLPFDILLEICKATVTSSEPILVNSHDHNRSPPPRWPGPRGSHIWKSKERLYTIDEARQLLIKRRRDAAKTRHLLSFCFVNTDYYGLGTRAYYADNTFKFADTQSFERFHAGLPRIRWTQIRKIQVEDLESDLYGMGPLDMFGTMGMPLLGTLAMPRGLPGGMALALGTIRVDYPCDLDTEIWFDLVRMHQRGRARRLVTHTQIAYAMRKLVHTSENFKLKSVKRLELYCRQCKVDLVLQRMDMYVTNYPFGWTLGPNPRPTAKIFACRGRCYLGPGT